MMIIVLNNNSNNNAHDNDIHSLISSQPLLLSVVEQGDCRASGRRILNLPQRDENYRVGFKEDPCFAQAKNVHLKKSAEKHMFWKTTDFF